MPTILNANLCPVPVVPGSLSNPSSGVPLTSDAYVTADSQLRTKLNRNALRADLIGRWGGGGYAICTGLVISAGAGLTLNVSAGQAMIDGDVQPSATTLALMDNITRAYIYLSQAGVLSAVNNSLTPPAGAQAFLGSAVTAAGAITSVDTSGVVYSKGGRLERWTADTSCPTDTPPSGLSFVNKGSSGCWIWTGQEYVCLQGGRASLTFSSDGNKTLSAVEYENDFLDFVNTSGSTLTATRNVTFPTQAGRTWVVRNNSLGAQSLVLKTAGGTGPTLLTAKIQNVVCDGTDIIATSTAI